MGLARSLAGSRGAGGGSGDSWGPFPLDALPAADRALCVFARCDGQRLFSGYRGPLAGAQRNSDNRTAHIYSKAQAISFGGGTTAVLLRRVYDQSGHGHHFDAVSKARMAMLVQDDGTPYTKPNGALAHQPANYTYATRPETFVPDYQRSGTLGLPNDASAFEHWHDFAADPSIDGEVYHLYFTKDGDFANLVPYNLDVTIYTGLRSTVLPSRYMNASEANLQLYFDGGSGPSEFAVRTVLPAAATTATVDAYFNGALHGQRQVFTAGNFTLADATEVGLCVEPVGMKPRTCDLVFAGTVSSEGVTVLNDFFESMRTP